MEPSPPAPDEPVRSHHAVLAVCVAMAVVGVNTTAVGVASRGIADDLGASLGDLEWIMSAYLVTAAAFALVGGRMGDVVGRTRTMLIGIGIMVGGSVLAALAPGTGALIVGRALQGLGAALIVPASIEVVAAHAPDTGPRMGFRARGVVYAVGFGVGPLVGGLITDTVSWRAVFWFEVVGLVAAAVLARSVVHAATREPRSPTRDFLGAGLSASTVFLTVFGISRGRVWGWRSWPMLAIAVVVVILVLWLVRVESRTERPLLHRGVLRDRTVIGANLATLGASIGMIGLVYFYAVFAQSALVFDSTPAAVALGLIPFAVSVIGFALIASFLARRIGGAGPVVVGLGLSVIGFGLLSRVVVATTEAQLLVPLILCGVGAGIANAGLTAPAVMTDRRRIDEAAGLVSLTRFLGSALAIVIGTASYLAVWGYDRQNPPGSASISSETAAVGGRTYRQAVAALSQDLRRPIESATHANAVHGFASTMRVAAIALAVLTVASAILLAPRRPGAADRPS